MSFNSFQLSVPVTIIWTCCFLKKRHRCSTRILNKKDASPFSQTKLDVLHRFDVQNWLLHKKISIISTDYSLRTNWEKLFFVKIIQHGILLSFLGVKCSRLQCRHEKLVGRHFPRNLFFNKIFPEKKKTVPNKVVFPTHLTSRKKKIPDKFDFPTSLKFYSGTFFLHVPENSLGFLDTLIDNISVFHLRFITTTLFIIYFQSYQITFIKYIHQSYI